MVASVSEILEANLRYFQGDISDMDEIFRGEKGMDVTVYDACID